MRTRFLLPLVLLWLALAMSALASPLDEGKALYKEGDYAGAARLFEQHVRENPTEARGWYNLGLALSKLQRHEEAVKAYEKAQALDLAIGFTQPSKFREKMAEAREKAGMASAASVPDGTTRGDRTLYRRAKDRYDAGDYAAAAEGFRRFLDSNPDDARAWYNLGLSYAKLRRYEEALAAYSRAQEADPEIGFTTRAKFLEKMQEAQRKSVAMAPQGAAPPIGGGEAHAHAPPGPDEEELIRALQQKSVIVMPGARSRLPAQDEGAIERFATSGHPHLKVVALSTDPGDRAAFTHSLHRYLQMGDAALIVVTPQGVSAETRALSRASLQRLTNSSARYFAMSWREGVERLGAGIRAEVRAGTLRRRGFWLAVVLAVVGLLWWRSVRKRRAFERTADEARQQAAALAQNLQEAETDVRLTQDQRVKDYYAQASQRFVEASAILENLSTLADARRASALLTEAQRLLEYSENPESAPRTGLAPQAPTQHENTAACFFCSRPAGEGLLRPASLSIEGETQRVLACRDCSGELRQGRVPRVRVVREGDEDVPWFRSTTYDPRRDWRRDDFDMRDVLLYSYLLHGHPYDTPSIVFVDDDRLLERRMEDASAASLEYERERSASTDFGLAGDRERAASTGFSLGSDGDRSASTGFFGADQS